MNYLKIYTLLLCAVLIAACSDDEEQFNSGAATVSLQETVMTVKESAGLWHRLWYFRCQQYAYSMPVRFC